MDKTVMRNREAAPKNRLVALRRAESFLRERIDHLFSSRALSLATRMSERCIQIVFKETYGVPPQIWFQHIRLKAAREDLLRVNKAETRVSDIAARWRFFHLGRFSTKYRQLFRETPSAILSNKTRRSFIKS
jgi:AraC family transcriptional regulator, ethanolamine operon transcriptional activator